MMEECEYLEGLKRQGHLIILPFILLSALVTFFLHLSTRQSGISLYLNILVLVVLILSWLGFYYKYGRRLFELLLFFLLLICYWFSVLVTIQSYTTNEQFVGSSWFMIWQPLLLIYIFSIFPRNKAMGLSIALFVMSNFPVVYYFNELNGDYIKLTGQVSIASIVYLIIVNYVFKLLEAHAENGYMRHQFYLDPLTQIGNRYQINNWMASAFESIDESPFSLIFFDIDCFKNINDQFGHVKGDEVLQELVSVVQGKIGGQHFGRWGGEEFMVFTTTSERESFLLAEELRSALEAHYFNDVGQVTASFGVTSYEEGDTVQSVLTRVDERLYESKRRGRNRVTGKV